MPIGLQTPLQGHTGNGVTTTFAYNFGILAAADLKVRVAGSIVASGYSVTGIGNRAGGTVVFSTAPGSGVEVLLYRSVSRDRATDYQTNGDLRADVLDDDLDRIVMALQEDAEILTRCVRAPTGESLGELAAADSRANKVLTFGAGGAIALVDLAAFAGGGVVELVPADGSITLTKLAASVQSLINGALQKSGGTMTGALVLPSNAVNALEAVPKQQLDAAVAAAASALSFSGLALSSTGTSASVAIAANELLLRGADGSPRLVSGVSLSLNTAGTGANGLDTGTLAASTWYAAWVISNGATTASLLSLSDAAPTMPSGYTHKARVGWIRTDSTANKYPARFTQFGRRVDYAPATGTNLTAYPTLFSGSTSGPASLANFIPATAGVVRGLVQYSATNTASISSEDGAQLYIFDSGTGPAALRSPFEVITRTRAIVVGSSGAAAGLVVGWEDNL